MRLVVDLGAEIEFVRQGQPGAYPWIVSADNLLIAARLVTIDGYGSETANVRVALDNTGRQASELLGYALRAPAKLYDDNDELEFDGLVQGVEAVGPVLGLTLYAGSELLLTERLPLRTTKALGDYSEDVVLPIPFGDLTEAPFPLYRLSPTRYFAADCPMEITAAFTGRQRVFNWQRLLESDEQDHTWTIVEFDAPVPADLEVWACGRGKLSRRTGGATTNPGDVFDLTSELAGSNEDWSQLRADTSALDLRIAGRFYERKSIQQTRDALAQSIGAITWHGGARLYPTVADPSPILDLAKAEILPGTLRASASLTDTADVLRLAFDVADATERPQQYIELTASPRRYNGLAKEIVLPYLRSSANAQAVGVPALQRLNGERYDVEFSTTNTDVRVGMWVRPVAHPEWMVSADDPIIMVLSALLDRDTNTVEVRGETIIGRSRVTLTAHSIALPDEVEASIDVSVADGVATFTVRDTDGRPLKGAQLSLDGGQAKTTDAQGKARFPVTIVPGFPVEHVLAFQKAGFVPFTVIVPL